MARQPAVDLVVGPQSYHNLPQLLAKGRGAIDTEFPVEDKFDHLPPARKGGLSAFLTVQEGCDKFCTFCVVPYTRGAEVSRPAEKIVAEAEALVRSGTAEITLLGQNVNAYHGAGADGTDWSLAQLIGQLARIEGLQRIRFTTSHPNDMSDDLIDAFGAEPKLMPYLHLPVQSGSDRVLKAMNRKHTAASYLKIIERLRDVRPDMAISGDFITGFPGETEEDFEDTLALVRAVGYAQAFSFKYSARPGTPAAERAEVPEAQKAERLHRLQALLTEQQVAFQEAQVGRDLPVLLEKPGRMEGQLVGKSPYLQAVHLDAPQEMLGRIVTARIVASAPNSLAAQLQGYKITGDFRLYLGRQR